MMKLKVNGDKRTVHTLELLPGEGVELEYAELGRTQRVEVTSTGGGSGGADGKTVLNGAGAPAAGLGTNGDFYIDTTADVIYGPKTAGGWGSATPLVGPQGPQGDPGLQGDEGQQGPQGIQGNPGVKGDTGDTGPQGDAGPQGNPGTPGADGEGVPTGGTAGQVLTKDTATDFDTSWQTPAAGGGGGVSPLILTILTQATGTAWANMPAAMTFFNGGHRYVQKVDLTDYTEVRLVVNKQNTAGFAGSKLMLHYNTVFSTTVTDYLDIGTSEVSVGIDVQNTVLATAWVPLAAGAKADVFICLAGSGGNATVDPAFGSITAQFR